MCLGCDRQSGKKTTYKEPCNILIEQSYLLLNIGTLSVNLFGVIHLFVLFLQMCNPLVALLNLLLVNTRSTNIMGTVKGDAPQPF